jgi:adenine-specific DNA methylase
MTKQRIRCPNCGQWVRGVRHWWTDATMVPTHSCRRTRHAVRKETDAARHMRAAKLDKARQRAALLQCVIIDQDAPVYRDYHFPKVVSQ